VQRICSSCHVPQVLLTDVRSVPTRVILKIRPWHWERIRAYYGEHNPSKMDDIPALLKKYKGKEKKLWRKLTAKYDRKNHFDDSD